MPFVIREKLTFCYVIRTSDPNDRGSHGKIGFKELAHTVSTNWKLISPSERAHFYKLQEESKLRYQLDMTEYQERMREWKASHPSSEPVPVQSTSVSTSPVPTGSSASLEPAAQLGRLVYHSLHSHSCFAATPDSTPHGGSLIDRAFQSVKFEAEDFQPLAIFREELDKTNNQDCSVETFAQLW